jgi:CRISPR-associated protein (TIGR02584 family)
MPDMEAKHAISGQPSPASRAQASVGSRQPGAAGTPEPGVPSSHSRRILLAVTGLSPQVVTETLYALAVKPARDEERFVPTEVHLLTTAQGADNARLNLLSDQIGWFHRLRADFGLPDIAFAPTHIHIVHGPDGRALDDIRSREENEFAADFITEQVRQLTADDAAALHVSIAGGRKTMGYYLGYALSLYGRAQDRLSHVLVSSPYENHQGFYYPTPYEHVIHVKQNGKDIAYDCRKAVVDLAEIPFVRMRHGLDDRLREGRATFNESVAAIQGALGPADITLDLPGSRLRAAGRVIALPPAELALLAVFARRARDGEQPIAAPNKELPDRGWAERYLAEYRAVRGEMSDMDETERALRKGMDGNYFSSHLSKLHRAIKKALGPAAQPYLANNGGVRPGRYRLTLPPEAIHFAPVEVEAGAD